MKLQNAIDVRPAPFSAWLARTKDRRRFATKGGFDAAWYLSRYSDVAGADFDPLQHFLTSGLAEGRFPHPLFDPRFYLARYPDVRDSGENPFLHYLRHGARERRAPNAWFDPEVYLSRVTDPAALENPAHHYLQNGSLSGPAPSRMFDIDAYARACPELRESGANPLAHFLHNPLCATQGWIGGLTSTYVAGWACRMVGPPLRLTVRVNDEDVGVVEPWLPRSDVKAIGLAEKSGYFFSFARRLSSGDRVEVRDENLGDLLGSPRIYQVKPLSPDLGFIETRASIAATFLRGAGLEIGGYTQPTDLPPDLEVEYYDKFPPEVVRGYYDETCGRPLAEPKYHGDAQILEGIAADKQFDFVIANHVIEHMEDPIQFIRTLARVLRLEGRAMVTAPNKRFSFDRDRDLTSFGHLIDDHLRGAHRSRRAHYLDFVDKVDHMSGEAGARHAEDLAARDFSIHFHVWDESTFVGFVAAAIEGFAPELALIFSYSANHEITVILERIR